MATPEYRFGYRVAWMAFRSADPQAVAKALGFRDSMEVGWEKGVRDAYAELGAFIGRPVQGWVLVVDRELMSAIERDTSRLASKFGELSRSFGEIQYYLNYRVSSCHAWVRAVGGSIVRAYASADGEIYWNEGPLTREEAELQIAGDEYFPNESDVVNLAEKWSINPESLNDGRVTSPFGLFGKLRLWPDAFDARQFEVRSDQLPFRHPT